MELWGREAVNNVLDHEETDLKASYYISPGKNGTNEKLHILTPLETPLENDIRKIKFDVNIKEEELNLGELKVIWLLRPELRKLKRIPVEMQNGKFTNLKSFFSHIRVYPSYIS